MPHDAAEPVLTLLSNGATYFIPGATVSRCITYAAINCDGGTGSAVGQTDRQLAANFATTQSIQSATSQITAGLTTPAY